MQNIEEKDKKAWYLSVMISSFTMVMFMALVSFFGYLFMLKREIEQREAYIQENHSQLTWEELK